MKKSFLLLVSALLLSSCEFNIIVTSPYTTNSDGSVIYQQPSINNSTINKVVNIIENKWRSDIYYKDVAEKDAAVAQFISCISGFTTTQGLDPYTGFTYTGPTGVSSVYYTGKIGITLSNFFQVPVVSFINPNSAGEDAGIELNDIIYGIGKKTIGGSFKYHYFYEENYDFSTLISSGAGNIGDEVSLKFYRFEDDELVDHEVTVTLKEAPTVLNAYELEAPDSDTLMIKLNEFSYDSTDKQLKEILKKNSEQETPKNKLVIDLIDNPGGSLNCVVNCLSNFIEKDSIAVTLEDKDLKKTNYLTNSDTQYEFDSYTILCSNNTASAAEVFIKCMQYYYPEVRLIGGKTYGKSIATNTETINSNWSFQYVCAKWLDPNGDWFEMYDGIEPSIENDKPDTLKLCQNIYAYMSYDEHFEYDTVSSNNLYLANFLNYFYDKELRTDGYFDIDMFEAVKEYQLSKGLEETGSIDTMTFINMVNDYAQVLKTYKESFKDLIINE